MHTIDFINLRQFKEGNVQEDEFKEKKIELYRQTIEFIENMKKSKHPVTVCWLLEILHILTNKFPPPASLSTETRLIKKMDSTFQFLLTQAAKIIESDTILLEKTRECNL